MEYHQLPYSLSLDKQAGKSEDEKQECVAIFQKLTMYYECLVDPVKRERYDTTGLFSPSGMARPSLL